MSEAIQILADERMADSSEKAFVIALREGKIKPQEIYKTMAVMRYTWNAKRGYWTWKPRQLKSVRRIIKIVRKIDDGIFLMAAL